MSGTFSVQTLQQKTCLFEMKGEEEKQRRGHASNHCHINQQPKEDLLSKKQERSQNTKVEYHPRSQSCKDLRNAGL